MLTTISTDEIVDMPEHDEGMGALLIPADMYVFLGIAIPFLFGGGDMPSSNSRLAADSVLFRFMDISNLLDIPSDFDI
jgi:hypothetical protein